MRTILWKLKGCNQKPWLKIIFTCPYNVNPISRIWKISYSLKPLSLLHRPRPLSHMGGRGHNKERNHKFGSRELLGWGWFNCLPCCLTRFSPRLMKPLWFQNPSFLIIKASCFQNFVIQVQLPLCSFKMPGNEQHTRDSVLCSSWQSRQVEARFLPARTWSPNQEESWNLFIPTFQKLKHG